MDGVLADFESELGRRWAELWPDDDFKLYSQRTRFDADQKSVAIPDVQSKFYQIYTTPGLFATFEPIADGRGLEAINQLLTKDYDVRIVTSAGSQVHAFGEKAEWVMNHLGREWVRRLVVTRDKYFIDGDVLIDDRPNACKDEDSSWQQIIYDQPYNQQVDDCPRLSWGDGDWLHTIEQTVAQVQASR